ncbi:AT-rich interactive domain-containing protein 5B [Syngnathoides biaculeatus]|uniref:AT-rich interactive domain-containing protein 5B n=1 Tax=Syngnathoides biaculeatus TaxID=300417 RepID=UPI002ADD98DA|nr:AT-rich interactive domain-containing protein 5B [Syngnathoides biaculeatus]
MEHNAIQWLGAPSCQRGSYAFYKSVGSKTRADGPMRVWRLGEFYFVRCGPGDPVCIAEVTLLWEDKAQRHLLASARLYFLPEDTPKGRTREHGEDEVLAVSRKMVLRVEDLVRWSCAEPAGWSDKPKAAPCVANGLRKAAESGDADGANNTTDCKPLKDKRENVMGECQNVKVLSYPQYCRYRSLQRRIQDGARGPTLQDAHLLALGGVRVTPSTRLMYCRDTFNHPTLEGSVGFSWQFRCPSLSLRGRPRKRRGRDGREGPTAGQSESWIERMKENVMGSVEAGSEGGWLPHPEEQLFLDELFAFMERQGSPIHKVPNLGFKKIDLFLMYSVVRRLGGYEKVTSERMWKVVYNELGGCPGSTSAATCTRRHYERLMLPYEEHLIAGGMEVKIPQCTLPMKPRGIRGRKPLSRGRKPGPKVKAKMAATPPSTIATADGAPVVVKRGRGRPPGKRNKATLLAQAKLLAQQQAKVKAESPKPLLPAQGSAGVTPNSSSAQQVLQHLPSPSLQPIQPALLPVNMPPTPDLSPMSTPFLPFQPKPKDPKDQAGDSVPLAPGVLISALPRHFVGGSLGRFSPIKGLCPLDVLRNCVGLQRVLESPAPTPLEPSQPHTTIYAIQPKHRSPATPVPSGEQTLSPPHPIQQHCNPCSGRNMDEDTQRGGARETRNCHPLPPLRVLPLDLDCSVQVRQLMRTRLGSTQFQTFTRRLSEALSQDLSAKPPSSPITPPPEQALPLNLSKRFTLKRPGTDPVELARVTTNGTAEEPSLKKVKADCLERAEDLSLGGGGARCPDTGSTGHEGQERGPKNQDEPADLSSPSRIRAFLLGLPPFQVKLDEDLNGMKFGKVLPSGSATESQTTATILKEAEAEITETSDHKSESLTKQVGNVEMLNLAVKEEGNASVDKMEDFSDQTMASVEKCDVETSKGHPSPVLPQPSALVLAQQS